MNAIDRLEKALLQAGLLAKGSGGFADLARATVAGLREVDSRLAALEKRTEDEQAARFGFGAADSDRARISQLEAELAVLKGRHEPAAHVEGLANTLGLGRATQGAETGKIPPAARAVDPWRH
jgi:hypothetical protein